MLQIVSYAHITSHRREEIGAGGEFELARDLGAEARGIGDGAVALRLQYRAAVGLGDEPAKREPARGNGGVGGDRRAAGALEHREEGALGRERKRGVGVVDGAQERERAIVVATRLDGDDALPNRRQKLLDREHCGRRLLEAEALQTGE